MRKIVVGSRRSNLALTQTKWVINELKKAGVPNEFEIKEIVTKGDRILDVTLSKVGGKGLFVKEIEQAMYDKEIDIAVHSMKDMPSVMPEGLVISSIPVREDPRDAFVSKNNITLKNLPEGANVGTSSLRRAAQVLKARPDINIKWIRGNIETRIRKLHEEDYDAIILAASGLKRAGHDNGIVTEYLEPEVVVPAVGQGALAIECREDDQEIREILNKINDSYTTRTVTAERTFLQLLDGGCQVPIGGYAYLEDDEIVLTALVGTPDGKTILKEVVRGTDPKAVGEEAATLLINQGGKEIVERVKEELDK
ncbi:hydroxymethylbilane synthase [Oceanobacillus caeni]|uniref:hydroxymethylbilane synthase n=1 Tax=Oceanobacillus TaxID=182709 RepID=UPI00062268DE|nr:hydroxymethylbilane synthase [Oceanobacillus caeni]KKE80509.1 porphobilinogen deaminase [Bacilli bacterium VT-13-104]PZD87741.1 hydroxymethylbilane synthase [Bacilli bacterium]MCR1833973.1 hydroxymethylbilane synthase [Oceanobacillus caeni]MED4474244.1 hydroxymethylbilane synthase [Oceanobacillus caeni]PZD89082.1 hydroxymethylbilane synthase [Bacilli bacterium]